MAGDPTLTVLLSAGEEAIPILRDAICRIGRSEDSTIVLADGLASREHAMIRRNAEGDCYLTDLGSRNGTLVNGSSVVVPVKLADGDTIRIGLHEFRFNLPDQTRFAAERPAAAATQIFFANSLISVLVVDVRGYTTLARTLGEQRTSALMSEIFHGAGEMLGRRRSWSQKYIGDAIMAVWVHPGPQVALDELLAIIETVGELRGIFARARERFGLEQPLAFGVGLNFGFASIGNMGSAALSDFTAMGDTVNKAFRLEAATRTLNCDVIVGHSATDFVAQPVGRALRLRAVEAPIKGYDKPERMFALSFDDLPRLAAMIVAQIEQDGRSPRQARGG